MNVETFLLSDSELKEVSIKLAILEKQKDELTENIEITKGLFRQGSREYAENNRTIADGEIVKVYRQETKDHFQFIDYAIVGKCFVTPDGEQLKIIYTLYKMKEDNSKSRFRFEPKLAGLYASNLYPYYIERRFYINNDF